MDEENHMRRCLKSLLFGLLACHLAVTAAWAAESGSQKDLGDLLVQNTPATHYIWTNNIWYQTGASHTLHWTFDPQGDPYPYTVFVYRENIRTGAREYVSNGGVSPQVRDAFGNPPGSFEPRALSAVTSMQLFSGPVPAAGNWQYVAELRDVTATRVIKSAWAKFNVVTEAVTLGEGAVDTEITQDTTWTADKVYRLRYQVFVHDGVTLTIEPGTVVVSQGQNAILVIEKGGKIVANGSRSLPIVMSCDAAVGERFPGCWAGLVVLGQAPVNVAAADAIAEGIIPATRPVYGGDDPDASSGVLRFVRVEFAGVDFSAEIQPNAFGFHGVGRGTVIEYIQSHYGEDDGIEFFGGTANMKYFVSEASRDDSVDWTFGWNGFAQHGLILQDATGDNGLEADNNEDGINNEPRSHPRFWNMTIIGNPATDLGALFRLGTAVSLRNCIIANFGEFGMEITNDSVPQIAAGNLVVDNCTFWDNAAGEETLAAQLEANAATYLSGQDNVTAANPLLRNIRNEGNPDPRLLDGSPLGLVGAGATPPAVDEPDGDSDILFHFDTWATWQGAFNASVNWLDEWTFFGPEEAYQ
jgi:hypothetical protein